MVSDQMKTADQLLSEQTNTSDRMIAYQKRWESELPGNPNMAFVGIFLGLMMFCVLGALPSVMSYLQDEGIIHPRASTCATRTAQGIAESLRSKTLCRLPHDEPHFFGSHPRRSLT